MILLTVKVHPTLSEMLVYQINYLGSSRQGFFTYNISRSISEIFYEDPDAGRKKNDFIGFFLATFSELSSNPELQEMDGKKFQIECKTDSGKEFAKIILNKLTVINP